MNCTKCGTYNEQGAVFCSNCGNKLVEDTPVSLNENQTQINQVQSEVIPSVTQVNEPTPNVVSNQTNMMNQVVEETNTKPALNNKIVMIVGVVIGIIILAIVAITITSLGKDNNSSSNSSNGSTQGSNSSKPIPEGFEKIENTTFEVAKNFDNSYLIPVYKDNKYGYIDNQGKLVVDYVLDGASEFYGEYALIEVDKKDGYSMTYMIINKNLDIIYEGHSYDLKHIDKVNEWLIDGKLYDINLKQISAEGLKVDYEDDGLFTWEDKEEKHGGIMDMHGKITYTYTYEDGESYFGINVEDTSEQLTDVYVVGVVDNKKYAIVNAYNGTVVYDYTTNYISGQDDNVFEIKTKSAGDFIEAVYVKDDKIAYRTTLEDSIEYSENAYTLREDTGAYEWNYLRSDGTMGEREYNNANSHKEWERFVDYEITEENAKLGLAKNGQQILANEYTRIRPFDIDVYTYLLSINKNYILLDKDNVTIIYDLTNNKEVYRIKSGVLPSMQGAFVIFEQDSKYNVYNLKTDKISTIEDNYYTTFKYDYYYVRSNDKYNYYNMEMNHIFTQER